MTLNICANYGGRWDVVDAVNRLVRDGKPVTVETVTDAVSMQWAGPVDLMIRTGESSGFQTFFSGSSRTPNCGLPKSCGPTSAKPTSMRR